MQAQLTKLNEQSIESKLDIIEKIEVIDIKDSLLMDGSDMGKSHVTTTRMTQSNIRQSTVQPVIESVEPDEDLLQIVHLQALELEKHEDVFKSEHSHKSDPVVLDQSEEEEEGNGLSNFL